MSGPVLRRKAHPARVDPPEEDVENPGQRRSFAPGGRDQIAVAKAIFRKVVAWLMSDDSDDEEQSLPQLLVSTLKDIAIGLVLGILLIGVMVVLDHRGIIHMQSAHDMREAANYLLSDPATLASVEEAAGIKFLKPEEHAEMEMALKGYAQQKAEIDAKAKEKEAAGSKSKELIDAKVPEEYKELVSNPLLELGRYCDICESNGRTCKDRAEEAAKADGGRVAARLKIMEAEAALYEKKEAGATCSFPPGCRWDCYLENNAPLKEAWGDDEQKASQHFFRHGFKEGRSCECEGG